MSRKATLVNNLKTISSRLISKEFADIVNLIYSGSSGVVSEVVNGKRAISKAQAKALGDYFKISPSLFI
jgi:antitoxin component HigA of HigAB toxin-antitoxin module